MKKLRYGVSRCLLGEACRYDGRDKKCPAVASLPFDWVPVCPETDSGLGLPREPMHVEDGRLITNTTRRDRTQPLQRWIECKLEALAADLPDGFILKARSPSCDLRQGLFAVALQKRFPHLYVTDEEHLEHLTDNPEE